MSGRDYLLDTNIVVPFLNGEGSIVKKISKLEVVQLPSIVLGELYFGASKSAHTNQNIAKINDFILQCELYPITETTALFYGQIKASLKSQGTPIPENDIWIAAVCMERDMVLISRDKHFKNVQNLEIKSW